MIINKYVSCAALRRLVTVLYSMLYSRVNYRVDAPLIISEVPYVQLGATLERALGQPRAWPHLDPHTRTARTRACRCQDTLAEARSYSYVSTGSRSCAQPWQRMGAAASTEHVPPAATPSHTYPTPRGAHRLPVVARRYTCARGWGIRRHGRRRG